MEFLVLALLVLMPAANILCFMVGAKVGQAVIRKEEVKLPNLNPIAAIREQEAEKKAKREQDRMAIIIQNMEGYDGTANGQKEVPRG